jgi:hypothetical protein
LRVSSVPPRSTPSAKEGSGGWYREGWSLKEKTTVPPHGGRVVSLFSLPSVPPLYHPGTTGTTQGARPRENPPPGPIAPGAPGGNWKAPAWLRRGEPALTDEERRHYTRLAAQRIARADRTEAARLRRLGREVEAEAFEQSAVEAETRAGA